MTASNSLATPPKKKLPLLLKIYAVALIALSVISIPIAAILGFYLPSLTSDAGTPIDTTTLVIAIVQIALTGVGAVMSIVLGVRMLRDRRRGARIAAEILVAINVAVMVCEVMLSGLHGPGLYEVLHLVFLVALLSYIDPSLSEERRLQRKLADLETRERAEDGTLGRDETGKGYIELNFFNLFWIFVVCCVLGLIIEVIYHMAVVEPGVYQDRAGLLYGPFSPIYGIGAVLMTIALNRFHKANFLVIFLVSAVIGGAFEYLVSWFFQFAFGIMAWDYTGTFLSIDGRTNRHVHGHVGRFGLRVDQTAFAAHAQGRECDSLEMAIRSYLGVRRAHARQRRYDHARVRLLVSARGWNGAGERHGAILRGVLRQRFHGRSLPEHDH